MNLNCQPEEQVSREIQRIMIVQPTVRFQPVEVFEPVQFQQNPEPIQPFREYRSQLPYAPRYFDGGCGAHEFVCSQNFTGRRFDECCYGRRRF
jgi:hypothetical protein